MIKDLPKLLEILSALKQLDPNASLLLQLDYQSPEEKPQVFCHFNATFKADEEINWLEIWEGECVGKEGENIYLWRYKRKC